MIAVVPAARSLRGAKAKTNFAPPPCHDTFRSPGYNAATAHVSVPQANACTQPTTTGGKTSRRTCTSRAPRKPDSTRKITRGAKSSGAKAKVRLSDEVRTTEFMTHPPKKGVPLQSAMMAQLGRRTDSGWSLELDLKLGFCSPGQSCSSFESTQESTATYQSPDSSFLPGVTYQSFSAFSPDSPPLSYCHPCGLWVMAAHFFVYHTSYVGSPDSIRCGGIWRSWGIRSDTVSCILLKASLAVWMMTSLLIKLAAWF